ncbi:MAG TPA: hypothetical protein VGO68_16235 [Pyrinomonadaceae bacterium]|nr:hypothetical protein [Pyrinomonadaceae bacterium]
MGRISYIKASCRPITALALIDNCNKLITLDDENALALWDIVNAGDAREIAPADFSLFNIADFCCEWMNLSWRDDHLEITEPKLLGGFGHCVLRASHDGGFCVAGKAQVDGWPEEVWIGSDIYGWAAHAPAMFAIPAENPSEADQPEELVYKCQRIWLESNGTGRLAWIGLPNAQVQVAVSGNGRSCAVVDKQLKVMHIWATDEDELETSVVPPPPETNWHTFGFHDAVYLSDTGQIVLMRGTEGRVLVRKGGSSEWDEFDWIGPGERDEIRGGYYFSADQSALYVGMLSGGVIKIDFGEGGGVIKDRFEQPANRYAVHGDRTILRTIVVSHCASWIVGSGGRLMYVWEASDPRPRHQINLDESIQFARFIPGSSQFVTVSKNGECDIWDAKSGARQRRVASGVLEAAITRNGRFLCVKVEDAFGIRTLMLPIINGGG